MLFGAVTIPLAALVCTIPGLPEEAAGILIADRPMRSPGSGRGGVRFRPLLRVGPPPFITAGAGKLVSAGTALAGIAIPGAAGSALAVGAPAAGTRGAPARWPPRWGFDRALGAGMQMG